MSKVRPVSTKVMNCLIKVPPGTDISWYDAATPEDAAEALKLGASLHTTLKAMKAGEAVAALEARQASELASVRTAADERIAAIQKELEAAASERAEAISRIKTLYETQQAERSTAAASAAAAQLNAAQAELRVAQERCAALEARAEVLRAGRDADVRAAEERTKTLLQHAMDEKERSLMRADATLTTLKEAYERQTEELRTLSDLLRKKPSANSRVKGTDYENEFKDKLQAVYGIGDGFALVDTARSGIGHAGDYLMNWGDHTILWEVKNYDKAVPTAEVEKFRRDMKENPQVRVGVMVSRFTQITGMSGAGDRTIEFIEGKMLIYLSNFEAMSEDTLPNLLLLFRTWWAQDHASDEEDDAKIAAVRQIEKLYEEASKAKTEWRLHKSHMETAIRWMAERVEETDSRLRNALDMLKGAAKPVEVPTDIFRDPMGDAKSIADIQTLLRITEPCPSGSCVLNELALRFAEERGRMTRDTAKTHIRALLLDSAIDAPKGKLIRVNGLVLKQSGNIEHV